MPLIWNMQTTTIAITMGFREESNMPRDKKEPPRKVNDLRGGVHRKSVGLSIGMNTCHAIGDKDEAFVFLKVAR